jgi:N-acetylmuramoyl-L-alanine amidase
MSFLRWIQSPVLRQLRIALLLLGLTAGYAPPAPAFQLVVIDPGHGGVDPGTSWHGLLEKTLALDVAKRLETILRDNGVTTVMTRRYDKTVSLDDRAIMANRFPNSLLVSVHFNAIRLASISGYETFYRSPVSKQVALTIQKSLKETVPGIDRGVTFQDFAVLTRTKGPAVLIECGFISNKAEADRSNTAAHRQKLAEAIAKGVLRAKPLVEQEHHVSETKPAPETKVAPENPAQPPNSPTPPAPTQALAPSSPPLPSPPPTPPRPEPAVAPAPAPASPAVKPADQTLPIPPP